MSQTVRTATVDLNPSGPDRDGPVCVEWWKNVNGHWAGTGLGFSLPDDSAPYETYWFQGQAPHGHSTEQWNRIRAELTAAECRKFEAEIQAHLRKPNGQIVGSYPAVRVATAIDWRFMSPRRPT